MPFPSVEAERAQNIKRLILWGDGIFEEDTLRAAFNSHLSPEEFLAQVLLHTLQGQQEFQLPDVGAVIRAQYEGYGNSMAEKMQVHILAKRLENFYGNNNYELLQDQLSGLFSTRQMAYSSEPVSTQARQAKEQMHMMACHALMQQPLVGMSLPPAERLPLFNEALKETKRTLSSLEKKMLKTSLNERINFKSVEFHCRVIIDALNFQRQFFTEDTYSQKDFEIGYRRWLQDLGKYLNQFDKLSQEHFRRTH